MLTLRRGDAAADLLDPREHATRGEIVRVGDSTEAERVLRRFTTDEGSRAMRRALGITRDARDVSRLDDGQVMRAVADDVARGRLKVYAVHLGFALSRHVEAAPSPPVVASGATTTWIEIQLVDTKGNPVGGARYALDLADGTALEGTLDEKGRAFVDGIAPGSCKVSFPDIDRSDWRPA